MYHEKLEKQILIVLSVYLVFGMFGGKLENNISKIIAKIQPNTLLVI